MNILIADDTRTDLLILSSILEKEGYTVFKTHNGKEALNCFIKENIDLVLLDVIMPIMDGKEAAQEIKKASGDNLTPIIFLTSLSEEEDIADCLDAGGDDIIVKPYKKTILNAKIRSFERLANLYKTIEQQRDTISQYSNNLVQEQKIAKTLFDNIAHPGCIDSKNIRSLISPMSIFNGDIVLAGRNPLGEVYIFVGDFTGHGLPAAVGAMPVSEIFYGMVAKGFSMEDILKEINGKLNTILPSNVFCCGIMAHINYRDMNAEFWMAATPDIFIYHSKNRNYSKVSGKNLPLGVVENTNIDFSTKFFNLKEGDKIYFWSDGIIEATNEKGEMFGEQRIENFFANAPDPETVFDNLVSEVENFTQSKEQQDDLSLIEVTINQDEKNTVNEHSEKPIYSKKSGPMEWSLTYEIRTQTLKNFNPLPMLSHILMEVPTLKNHSGELYTILSEIYSNALEHGILELDSCEKSHPDGFSLYYKKREEKLDELYYGKIVFHIDHTLLSHDEGQLIITVNDSGEGYDHAKLKKCNNYSGRGFKILNDLCDNVEVKGNGNLIRVTYKWSLV